MYLLYQSMSVTSLTAGELVQNISNAFLGTINDMYRPVTEDDPSKSENILVKENRHMYLALLFLMMVIIGTFMFE